MSTMKTRLLFHFLNITVIVNYQATPLLWSIFHPKGQKPTTINVEWTKSEPVYVVIFSAVGREEIYLHWCVVGSVIDDTFRRANSEPAWVCGRQTEQRPTSNLHSGAHYGLFQRGAQIPWIQKEPTWETSGIPWFVQYPLNSEEKHHPPLMCFPSSYWPPLAVPLPSSRHKKQHLAGCVVSGPLIGLNQ